MECRRIEELLSSYLDKNLSGEEMARVEGHLRTCSRCPQELERLKRTVYLVSSLEEVEPPPGFLGSVRSRIEPELAWKRWVRKAIFPIHIKIPLEALAAIFIMAIIIYVSRPDHLSRQPLELVRQEEKEEIMEPEEITRAKVATEPLAPRALAHNRREREEEKAKIFVRRPPEMPPKAKVEVISQDFAPGEIIITFYDKVTEEEARALVKSHSLIWESHFPRLFRFWVKVLIGSPEDYIDDLESSNIVLWANHRGNPQGEPGAKYILVQFNIRATNETAHELIESFAGLKVSSSHYGLKWGVVKVPEGEEQKWMETFEKEDLVRHAQLNRIYRIPRPPDDRKKKELPALTPAPPGADNAGGTIPKGISAIINANNQFALDLYSKLRKEEGNIFFSPSSISLALAMTYEGARGQTAEEIGSVFHFPKDDAIRRSAFAALHHQLNRESVKYELRTANALWIQSGFPLLPEYLDIIKKYYGGKAANVDFAGAAEEARQIINSWVEDKTNNKIRDLFPPGSLSPLMRLVLTNAIYFQGTWVKQFDESDTREEDFRISEEKTVKVPLMRRTDREAIFNYAETEELQILEMLYEGEELSMLVLLPKNKALSSLEESLTLERLNQWKSGLREQRVKVFFPKFTFTSKYPLSAKLKEMGMPSAFTPGAADFSGLDGTKNLFIHTVVHQAFVEVSEEGTEAAAATGVGIGITSVGPRIPVFRADRPFLFMIRERSTGKILFLGRVVNPAA